MEKTLHQRMNDAITTLGGATGLLNLPAEVQKALMSCTNLEIKVKMLELIVEVSSKAKARRS